MKRALSKLAKSPNNYFGIIGIVCIAIFLSIYGVRVLDVTYTDWLVSGGDTTQHYLGWRAYRESAWTFPIGMVDCLAYPNQTSVIFTDSIPLFAVFFKLLSPILPADFQYFGIWGLLCFILQGVMAARILRHFTDNKVAIVFGSVLLVYTPFMIRRMFSHTALAGQWILLWALEPLFAPARYDDNKKIYAFAACIGAVSVAVHMYFFGMVTIIMLGICLQNVLRNKKITRAISILAAYLGAGVFITWILGGFSSGMSAGDMTLLGVPSANLNAFFNSHQWSVIYQELPCGYAQWEGNGYLGAGGIFLLFFCALLLLGQVNLFKETKRHWKIWMPMLLVFLVPFVFALSPKIMFGEQTLIELPLPEFILNIWAIFRATGRFVWISSYLLLLVSCVVLFKQCGKRLAIVTMCFVAALQFYDIHRQLDSRYEQFSPKVTSTSLSDGEAFWDTVGKDDEIQHVVYYRWDRDENLWPSVTDWALDNDKTVNTFYFARSMDELIEEDRKAAFETLSENNLYIFSVNDKAACAEYDLNYYEVSGMIVGLVNPVPGYTPLPASYFEEEAPANDESTQAEVSQAS